MIHENFVIGNNLGYDIRVGYHKNSHISRGRTMCCALGTLSMDNSTTLEEIEEVINDIKEETTPDNMRRNGGEKAIFVITLPSEERLAENLEKFGFKMVYEFHRRDCYPQDHMLKMWIYSWE
jgi:hypothetical protein